MREAGSADLPQDKGFLHLKQQTLKIYIKKKKLALFIQQAIIMLKTTVAAVTTHHIRT